MGGLTSQNPNFSTRVPGPVRKQLAGHDAGLVNCAQIPPFPIGDGKSIGRKNKTGLLLCWSIKYHIRVDSSQIGAKMGVYAVAICLFFSLSVVLCLRIPNLSSDIEKDTILSSVCHPGNQPNPRTLRSDQLTVLINGYSESRIPLLHSIAASYSASPVVSSVLVLWGNPHTSPLTLSHLAHNLSVSSWGNAAISLVPQSSSSLNARFLPRLSIGTRAVLVCDDDVEVDLKTVEFAFRMWKGNPDRLIGIFVRSHDIDMTRKEWIYTVHPNKYSIVLTKFMMMKREYLFKYSCGGGSLMREMRKMVDEMQNCEDILMNFVVAEETNTGPLMVGAERARDWGDPRNEDSDGDGLRLVRDVGLSSRKAEHRKRRGKCITEFHRVFGRMPLRFSYGKLVSSVGEQGLCKKGTNLVLCDH
ncbi:Exostosin-1c [Gossypium arboreum]|uniref:Exostosin-1c n=2 Tax=Gossypium arboreum TaxID=29729 RepID=A0A0B0NWF0_GOSAR|nr:Exostosin-1c [Gossypium arboreum]